MPDWRRHFFRTRTSVGTTWRLRLALLAVLGLAVVSTHGAWTRWIQESLVCGGGAV